MNELMTYFNVSYCSLFKEPKTSSSRLCNLPPGSVLILLEKGDMFSKVSFRTSTELVGYILTPLLDIIQEPLGANVVKLHGETPSLQDAAQYLRRNGNVWFNLCGEMCVTALLDPEKDLDKFLERWQAKSLNVYQRVFQKGLSAPTSLSDLKSMVDAYGAPSFDARAVLPYFTPIRLQDWLDNGWGLIVGVKINAQGRLRADGRTLHWIVVLDVTPNGVMDGLVTFYNSYVNAVRQCSWMEFTGAMGTLYGLLVKKAVQYD